MKVNQSLDIVNILMAIQELKGSRATTFDIEKTNSTQSEKN